MTTPQSDPYVHALKLTDEDISHRLSKMLFGDDFAKKQKWAELFASNPVFLPKFDLTLDQLRQQAYDRISAVSDAKLFSIFDFTNDPVNLFTAHEQLAQVDGSLATKFTVQFNLFGGTLMALHTERHLPFMRQVDSLKHMGCFCFTELGYGNNAPKMETTATYDKASGTFTIHSPTTLSQKYWITNGACHANWAIVFAQTIVEGKNEGISSFLVQIRDEQLKPCPGVMIEDMGVKMSLNGVDNGRLMFNQVKIPRAQMLNRLTDVDASGHFSSQFSKKSQRFFKVTDRLLSGRLCIASMSIACAKKALYIAIKYSQQRKAVGKTGLSDTPIMSYQLQQNAILPLMARTMVQNFGHNQAKQLFANQQGREHEVIKTLCAVKAMVTWNAEKVARICRERVGGGGFLEYNGISSVIGGSHSGMTAEGDNSVLMQKVTKDILQHEREGKFRMPECPSIELLRDQPSLSSLDSLVSLIYVKEHLELDNIKSILAQRVMVEGASFFEVWQAEVNDEIQSVALTFGERFFIESALAAWKKCDDQATKVVLERVMHLHCVAYVRENLGWFLKNQAISPRAAAEIEEVFQRSVKDLVPYVNVCIHGLGLQENQELFAPISRDYVTFNGQPDMENLKAAGPIFDPKTIRSPKL